MQNQIILILKVFAISAIASLAIKYAGPYLPIDALSEDTKSLVAGITVTLPVILYGIFLKLKA